MICANSISTDKTGFGVDTNKVTLIFKNHVEELPLCSKEETADMILDQIIKL
jgi:phosphopantothenoylcysteine decarboxylase/phosphopantothenate--cysteine ligase